MRILTILCCLFFSSKTISAQHVLRLLNSNQLEGVIIRTGDKIGYQLKSDSTLYKGEISNIKDTSIVINSKEISINAISLITLKAAAKKNIWGGLAVFAFEGALLGATELAGNDKVLNTVSAYAFIPAAVIGTFLIGRGILKLKKYDKYPIGEEWSIEIISSEKIKEQ